jgi:hypothetical protein
LAFLTDAQISQFLVRGHITIRSCFTPVEARAWTDEAWVRLGYDPLSPESWLEPRVHLPATHDVDAKALAPRAYTAACELLGGEDRVDLPGYGATA